MSGHGCDGSSLIDEISTREELSLTGVRPNQTVEWHTQRLLASIGVPSTGAKLTFLGSEVNVGSVHRNECAVSAAIGAQAVAAAHLWHLRTGGAQDVVIDRRKAVASLLSGQNQWIDGHDMSVSRAAEAPVSALFQTRDERWIYLVGLYPALRDGLLKLLDCPNDRVEIAAAVRKWNSFELEELIGALNLVGAVVRTRDEWRAHEQGVELSQSPLIEIRQVGDGPRIPLEPADRPLSGIRVIDFTHVLAGPTLTRTLAEHGADVLRLSSPRFPDPDELLLDTAWGKRGAYLDLDLAGNAEKLQTLLAEADVFVQSWSPRSMKRRGLTADELCARHPGLIYVHVNAFGFTGPWAERKGFEQLAQSVTGMAADEGGGGAPRLSATTPLADVLAAYLGAAGTMAALKRRSEAGGSWEVRVSLTGAIMWLQDLGHSGHSGGTPPTPEPVERPTPFGRLRHAGPVAHFSKTPADWTLPPCPPGAYPAQW